MFPPFCFTPRPTRFQRQYVVFSYAIWTIELFPRIARPLRDTSNRTKSPNSVRSPTAHLSLLLYARPASWHNRFGPSVPHRRPRQYAAQCGRRLPVVGFLIIGIDHLYESLPSRTPFEYFAISISAHSQSVTKTYLDTHSQSFTDFMYCILPFYLVSYSQCVYA